MYKKSPLIKRGSFLCLINNRVVNREITLLFIQKNLPCGVCVAKKSGEDVKY